MTGRIKTSRKRAQRNRFGGARLSVIPSFAHSFHEPSSPPVQTFVAYATKVCRRRFLASMRDFEIVGATHEPYPLIPSFSPNGGEGARRAVEGDSDRFMAPIHVLLWDVFATHEPQKVAQASCLFGADRLEACPTLQPAPRFMAPTHVRILEVLAFHEPCPLTPPSPPPRGRGCPKGG